MNQKEITEFFKTVRYGDELRIAFHRPTVLHVFEPAVRLVERDATDDPESVYFLDGSKITRKRAPDESPTGAWILHSNSSRVESVVKM